MDWCRLGVVVRARGSGEGYEYYSGFNQNLI